MLLVGSGSWIRTNDLRVMSPTSFHLLYPASICILCRLISLCWCRRPDSNRYDLEGSQDFKSCASANSATSAFLMAPRVGLEPTTYRLTAGCSTIELPRINTWRRPTFPGSFPPSIISAEELNFRVRDGNGCVLFAIATRSLFS